MARWELITLGVFWAVALNLPERFGWWCARTTLARLDRGLPYCHICGKPPVRCPYAETSREAARCPNSANPPG